jgi:hypothetical protein
MSDFWNELDDEVLRCLAARGHASPAEIARRLALSEDAVNSILAMLACDGKVRIGRVESVDAGALAA